MNEPTNDEIAQASKDMALWLHEQGHVEPLKTMLILTRVLGYVIAHCSLNAEQVHVASEQVGEVARFYWDYRLSQTQH